MSQLTKITAHSHTSSNPESGVRVISNSKKDDQGQEQHPHVIEQPYTRKLNMCVSVEKLMARLQMELLWAQLSALPY